MQTDREETSDAVQIEVGHVCGEDSYGDGCMQCLPLTDEDMNFDPRSLFVAGQPIRVKPMANESPSQFYLLPEQLLKVWDAVKIRHRFELGYDPEYLTDEELQIGELYAFYDGFGDAADHRAKYIELVEYCVYELASVDSGGTIVWQTTNGLSDITDESVSSAPAQAVLCSLMIEHHKFHGGIHSRKMWDCYGKLDYHFGGGSNWTIAKCYVIGTVDDCVNVRLETAEGEDITSILVKEDSCMRSEGLVPGDRPKTEDFNELLNQAVNLHGDARAMFQDGAVLDVRVTRIESARRFWVVPVACEEKANQLKKECPFGDLSADWYKLRTFTTPPSDPIEKGKMYWTQRGKDLVRGVVVDVDNIRRCLGRALDTGDVIECNPDDDPEFRRLSEEFKKMPPLAVECCLDIQPKNGSQEWGKDAVLQFHNLFTDGVFPHYDGKKIYEAVPTGQVKNGRIEVVLKDGDKNFATELFRFGFGEYMPQED